MLGKQEIDNFISCTPFQAPEIIKKHLSNSCKTLGSNSSSVIKELAETIKKMKKSSTIDLLVEEMNGAVLDLQTDLKSLSCLSNSNPPTIQETTNPENKTAEKKEQKTTASIPLMDVISAVSFASLLIEIASRIESIVEAVQELSNLAEFKVTDSKQNQQA